MISAALRTLILARQGLMGSATALFDIAAPGMFWNRIHCCWDFACIFANNGPVLLYEWRGRAQPVVSYGVCLKADPSVKGLFPTKVTGVYRLPEDSSPRHRDIYCHVSSLHIHMWSRG